MTRRNPLNRHRLGSAYGHSSSAAADHHPLPHFDGIDAAELIARLPQCSKVELTPIDDCERTHANRIDVRNKLRHVRGPEAVAG
jgi:hypothetical protein